MAVVAARAAVAATRAIAAAVLKADLAAGCKTPAVAMRAGATEAPRPAIVRQAARMVAAVGHRNRGTDRARVQAKPPDMAAAGITGPPADLAAGKPIRITIRTGIAQRITLARDRRITETISRSSIMRAITILADTATFTTDLRTMPIGTTGIGMAIGEGRGDITQWVGIGEAAPAGVGGLPPESPRSACRWDRPGAGATTAIGIRIGLRRRAA